VLSAARAAFADRGFDGATTRDIAARAGVNKTTVYRRWPTRDHLVIAAWTDLATPPVAVDTGRLESDLCATFMTATTLRATAVGLGVVRALIAERGNPEVERVLDALRERHRAPARRVLEHARRRGDLPRRVDIELLLDVLTGTINARLRERPGRLDPQWVGRVVRLVLSGATVRGRAKA